MTMVFGELVLVIAIIAAVIGGIIALISYFSGPNSGNRDLKRKLEKSEARRIQLEMAMDDLLSYAYENRTESASFADLVIDEIRKTKRKELES